MDESFTIPVSYENKKYYFDARLFTSAYNYRIEVLIKDVPFNFERDDSGSFRAIAVTPDDKLSQKTEAGLLQAIASKLEEILS